MSDPWIIVGVAGAAGIASPLGGLVAIWRQPTTLLMSLALGFAGGVLLGTIAFKMVPEALEMGGPAVTAVALSLGFAAVYGFDLWVHRGASRARLPSSVRRCGASTGAIRRAGTR